MNQENRNQSNPNSLSAPRLWLRRGVAAIAIGTTLTVGGANALERISEYNASQKAELLNNTDTYIVEEGGFVSEIAARLNAGDDVVAANIILELNPQYKATNIIPDNSEIILPVEYVNSNCEGIRSNESVAVAEVTSKAKIVIDNGNKKVIVTSKVGVPTEIDSIPTGIDSIRRPID